MSNDQELSAREIARHTRAFLKGAAAKLAGRERGADHGEGRVPRRHSYDADTDPRAKPWTKIGDGSVAQGLAHREALLQTAEELYHQGWKENPRAEIREARHRYDALAAELDALRAAGAAPIGRAAAIRQEMEALEPILARAASRLRGIDLRILKALLKKIDFATGALFPAQDTIAEAAGCHRNSVVEALKRLRRHGLIEWVRRSVRTGNDGEFAPQREQTSNAYYFDHRRRMAPRTWERYCQILVAKLRRLGPKKPPTPPEPRKVSDPYLRDLLTTLSYPVGNAST